MTKSEKSGPTSPAEARAVLEEALAREDLPAAASALSRLAELAPGSPDLAAFDGRVAELGGRAVREALAEAARLIREGRPRRALDVLAAVRPLAPESSDLGRAEAEAREAVDALDVRVRARPLIDQARRLSVAGDLEKALALAEDALRSAPDDARALRLRDELRAQLRTAGTGAPALATPDRIGAPPPEAAPQRPQLLASARAQLARGELDGAERDAQQALRLDPADPDTRALVSEIRARRQADARAERVASLVAEARRFLEANRFQACLALVAQLTKLEPGHPDARELQARAEAGLQAGETRRERIKANLGDGQAGLATGDLPRALVAFTAVLELDPEHAQARRGLAEARGRAEREQRRRAALASAAAQLERDEIDPADRAVQELLRQAPLDPEALALSERVWARRRELRQSRSPEAAPVPRPPTPADRPLSPSPAAPVPPPVAPDQPGLERLEARVRRAAQEGDTRSRVRALVERARRASVEGRLDEALALAEEAVSVAPDDARALRLRDELQDRAR